MQFASGKGTGTYATDPVVTTQYFVNPKAQNTTLSLSGGAFPTRTFTQGNYVPGIVISATGQTVNAFRCVLNSYSSGSDIGSITFTVQPESTWTGSATVQLQGGFNRYSNAVADWINIGSSITVTAALTTYQQTIALDEMLPVYRLQAVSTTGVGIIDWSISNMFPDISAEGIGNNATNVNGGLGQPAVLVNSSVPFGRESSWRGNTGNTGPNQTEIETMFTPGGQM